MGGTNPFLTFTLLTPPHIHSVPTHPVCPVHGIMLQKRQLKPARALKQQRSRLKNNVPFLRTAEGYPDLCHGDGWPISTRESGSHFPFPSLFSPLFLQPFQPHATPLLLLLLPVPPPPPPPRTYSPFALSPRLPSSPSPTYTYIDMYTFMYMCVHIYVCVCINGWGSLPLLCVCVLLVSRRIQS